MHNEIPPTKNFGVNHILPCITILSIITYTVIIYVIVVNNLWLIL